MKDEIFTFLAKLLREQSGLALPRDKEYLLESRLTPVARRHGHQTIEAMWPAIKGGQNRAIERDIVEAMTTNETFFFRDAGTFDTFRKAVLPAILTARAAAKTLRIWFAASSSGQEPYSVAIILEEERARLAGWNVDMVGTDISNEMVQRSRDGLYTHFEAQRGLPIQMLAKYFDKEEQGWRVKAPLRERIKFKTFNLLENFAALGTFDVIFCRNVLIYFDLATKRDILDRMNRQMAKTGALFLGGAETVIGVSDKFIPHPGHAGIFVPVQSVVLDRAVGQ
jgi:chemotaxis protein methyltransferase CheR